MTVKGAWGGRAVRLKVQITPCTCCLDEGRKGWKNCKDWTAIKAEEVGLGRKRLVRSRDWRAGSVLAVSALRSEVVALRLVLQKSKAGIGCCASSQPGVDWLQLRKARWSSGNRDQQAALWQHLVALQLRLEERQKKKGAVNIQLSL